MADAPVLLLDVGNSHTHMGLGTARRVGRTGDFPTAEWLNGKGKRALSRFMKGKRLTGVACCSVVPNVTPLIRRLCQEISLPFLELTPATVNGIGINYPRPETIGPDRLANAVAVRHHFGAPAVVVDFGTAVTFDVVDAKGNYIGGIIAPGLEVMTEYLHRRTALLPRIRIRETKASVGKSTEQAMLVGAVHGYRGLIRELIGRLKRELKVPRLPVVATGGYGKLIAAGLSEITSVEPRLTLEGLRLVWLARYPS